MNKQLLITLDLEGVLLPEIWQAISHYFAVPELMKTTRDEPDYNKLMTERLGLLKKNNIRIKEIETVLTKIEPLDGAQEFVQTIREAAVPLIILTDSFDLFVNTATRSLQLDTIFCHQFILDEAGNIVNWQLRTTDSKRTAVRALKSLNYRIHAAGDSLNDLPMLEEADRGCLFNPSSLTIEKAGGRFASHTDYKSLARDLLKRD